jgi:hypothetical protein
MLALFRKLNCTIFWFSVPRFIPGCEQCTRFKINNFSDNSSNDHTLPSFWNCVIVEFSLSLLDRTMKWMCAELELSRCILVYYSQNRTPSWKGSDKARQRSIGMQPNDFRWAGGAAESLAINVVPTTSPASLRYPKKQQIDPSAQRCHMHDHMRGDRWHHSCSLQVASSWAFLYIPSCISGAALTALCQD